MGGLVRYPGLAAATLLCLLAAAATWLPDQPVTILGWHAGKGWSPGLVSAHLVHLGGWHYLFNALGALLLGGLADRFQLTTHLPLAFLAILAGVDFGLVFGPWQIDWYVGLSALLYGLFAWLCLMLFSTSRDAVSRYAALMLLLTGATKVAMDLSIPVGAEDWRGMALATPAHVYGYSSGVFWAMLWRLRMARSSRPDKPSMK